MGKQLNKIVTDAISGDDSEEFGAKVFDLSEKGCNLRIKVEQNEGGYPTYVSSKFMSPSVLEGTTDLEAVYNSFKSMDSIFEHKTTEEINKLLKVHFLGEEEEVVVHKTESVEEEEFITPPQSVLENKVEQTQESNVDDRIQDLLKDL